MTEPIKIKVTGVTFIYTEDETDIEAVSTSFNSTDPLLLAYANGQVKISKEEYFSNPSVTALAELVKTKFIERLNATDVVEEA